MVSGPHEIDARVVSTCRVAGEACPREVDVPVAGPAGAVPLDRGFVVELAEQVRRRRALSNVDGAHELLAVVDRCTVRAPGVLVCGDPHVAQRLRRPFWVSRTLRSGEQAAMVIPGEDRIARLGRPNLRLRGERRLVPRI